MKVQITLSRKLRLSGERPLGEGNKWSRFHKEIPIDSNYDPNEIGAKFEKGILLIRHPKIIVPYNEPQEMIKPSTEAPKPPKPPHDDPQPPADTPKLKTQLSDVLKPRAMKTEPFMPEKREPQAADTSKRGSLQIKEKQKETSEEDQKRNGRTNAAEKGTTTANRGTKEAKVADFVQDKTDMNGIGTGIIRGSYYHFATENFKQVFGDMVMEMKKPRNFKNWVLVVLIAVLGLYAFRYLKKI